MVVTYYAATAPVNPSGASPVLTPAQVWEGLRRKVRHANHFVPPITSCVVEQEENNAVYRRVVFEGGKEMTEDGTEIENILAPGPGGELFLTYAFKWKFANIEQGSKEAQNLREEQQKVALGAVQSTTKVILELVLNGELKA